RPPPDAGPDAPETSCTTCGGDGAVPPSTCPAAPPATGDACASNGELCEYGPSWWLLCNTVFRCTSGQWQPAMRFGGAPWLLVDGGGEAGACPSTFAEASSIDSGLFCPAADCQYPEGYCECIRGCGGGGAQFHAGEMGQWACRPATTECPSPRPRLGT